MGLIIIGSNSAGALGQKFRTFAALSASLGATAVGTRAALWGPVDKCGWWRSEGGGDVRIDSDVDLTVLDGSETSDTDIVQLGFASAPTWGTPGASGGLIMDGSGSLSLPFLGDLPSQMHTFAALCEPTLTAEDDGQALAFGRWRLGAGTDLCFLGGIRRVVGVWTRSFAFDLNATPIYAGITTAPHQEPIVTGDEVLLGISQLITDSVSNRGAYWAGSYRGDSAGAPISQQANVTTTGAATAEPLHRAMLHVREMTGTISVRWTKLFIVAGQRTEGVTP